MRTADFSSSQATVAREEAERLMRMVDFTIERNVAALTRTALILEAAGFDAEALWDLIDRESLHVRYLRAWLGERQASLDQAPGAIH